MLASLCVLNVVWVDQFNVSHVGRGGVHVVNLLAFYFDNPSLIPAEVYNFDWVDKQKIITWLVKSNKNRSHEGGQAVNVLAFYSDNPSLNPTERLNFLCQ